MIVIGLTGGIGSGKSTVANLFANLGVPIIDTDQIAREAVEPGTAALDAIKQKFGEDIINTDGHLNRMVMRNRVFNDPTLRVWLESLLHPVIREQIAERISTLTHPYCIVVIPLLAESKPNPLIQRVLVVDCAPETQIHRASARDNSSIEQIQKIMASQATRAQRLAIADDIINNDNDLSQLEHQVNTLNKKYTKSIG